MFATSILLSLVAFLYPVDTVSPRYGDYKVRSFAFSDQNCAVDALTSWGFSLNQTSLTSPLIESCRFKVRQATGYGFIALFTCVDDMGWLSKPQFFARESDGSFRQYIYKAPEGPPDATFTPSIPTTVAVPDFGTTPPAEYSSTPEVTPVSTVISLAEYSNMTTAPVPVSLNLTILADAENYFWINFTSDGCKFALEYFNVPPPLSFPYSVVVQQLTNATCKATDTSTVFPGNFAQESLNLGRQIALGALVGCVNTAENSTGVPNFNPPLTPKIPEDGGHDVSYESHVSGSPSTSTKSTNATLTATKHATGTATATSGAQQKVIGGILGLFGAFFAI